MIGLKQMFLVSSSLSLSECLMKLHLLKDLWLCVLSSCTAVSVHFQVPCLFELLFFSHELEAYFLWRWMAISATLPITAIYIKFKINFTLFFIHNCVNSCCEAKLHTWILIALSSKPLWTLDRSAIFLFSSEEFTNRWGKSVIKTLYSIFLTMMTGFMK